jgi:hypothetical protein
MATPPVPSRYFFLLERRRTVRLIRAMCLVFLLVLAVVNAGVLVYTILTTRSGELAHLSWVVPILFGMASGLLALVLIGGYVKLGKYRCELERQLRNQRG